MHKLLFTPPWSKEPIELCMGLSLAPYGTDALWHGHGHSPGHAGRQFSPSDLFAGGTVAGFWGDMDATDALVFGTQPPLVDGNMEAAGTGYWAPIVGAPVLSKEGGAHGGDWCLRSTAAGTIWLVPGNGAGAAAANTYITGCRYSGLSAWAKSDGAAVLTVLLGTAASTAGTTSTAWHKISVPDATAVADNYLYLRATAGTIEIDDVDQGANLSVTTLRLKGTTATATQLTAANMPYSKALGARNGLYFAVEDGLPIGTDKSTQRWLHDGTGCTLVFIVSPETLASNRIIAGSIADFVSNGIQFQYNSSGVIRLYVMNGSGTALFDAQSAAGAVVAGRASLVTMRMNAGGCEIYVDGLLVASDYTPAGVPAAGDGTWLLKLGQQANVYASGLVGTLADPFAVAKYATDQELANLHRYFALKHAITLA